MHVASRAPGLFQQRSVVCCHRDVPADPDKEGAVVQDEIDQGRGDATAAGCADVRCPVALKWWHEQPQPAELGVSPGLMSQVDTGCGEAAWR
jgi:hypothetical protein